MPQVGFETSLSAGERPKFYDKDGVATGTGLNILHFSKIRKQLLITTPKNNFTLYKYAAVASRRLLTYLLIYLLTV